MMLKGTVGSKPTATAWLTSQYGNVRALGIDYRKKMNFGLREKYCVLERVAVQGKLLVDREV